MKILCIRGDDSRIVSLIRIQPGDCNGRGSALLGLADIDPVDLDDMFCDRTSFFGNGPVKCDSVRGDAMKGDAGGGGEVEAKEFDERGDGNVEER